MAMFGSRPIVQAQAPGRQGAARSAPLLAPGLGTALGAPMPPAGASEARSAATAAAILEARKQRKRATQKPTPTLAGGSVINPEPVTAPRSLLGY